VSAQGSGNVTPHNWLHPLLGACVRRTTRTRTIAHAAHAARVSVGVAEHVWIVVGVLYRDRE
jgi:hypothetical protein